MGDFRELLPELPDDLQWQRHEAGARWHLTSKFPGRRPLVTVNDEWLACIDPTAREATLRHIIENLPARPESAEADRAD